MTCTVDLPIKSRKITELFLFVPRSVSTVAVRPEIFTSHSFIPSNSLVLLSSLIVIVSKRAFDPMIISVLFTITRIEMYVH
jgi:hypothetical protein